MSILPINPLTTNCVLLGSVMKLVTLDMSTSERIMPPSPSGSLSIKGNPAFAASSTAVTVRTIYPLESSASPTKTGIIETKNHVKVRKTVKKVIRIPSISGIFQCLSLTTKGHRSKAKKQDTKKSPIRSRNV
jgi:hypothetical protein